ncbi:N-acetylglucosamine kinase [Natronospora cellulosivora (SeqCode)]
MRLFLGVDGGGTSTVSYLSNEKGQILGIGKSGPSNYHVVTREGAMEAVYNSIIKAYKMANINPEQGSIEMACFGLAGIDTKKDYQIIYPLLKGKINMLKDFILVNDAFLALAAGNEAADGVALIAGTGSIAVGINKEGARKRVGGWGHIFDDRGSGYNIAVNALHAIFREYDGRGEKTLLSKLFCEHLGVENQEGIIEKVYVEKMSRTDIAKLAKLVFRASNEGDMVAVNILWQAGLDLAELVYKLIIELDINDKKLILPLFGGVFKSKSKILYKIIKSELQYKLGIAKKVEKVELTRPNLQAPAGALLLAFDTTGNKGKAEFLNNLKRGINYVEKSIS